MLDTLYPLSYAISLFGLVLWFYFEEIESPFRKLMSTAFIGGFFVYLFSLAFADGSTAYKLLVLTRDMFVLGVVALGFNFLKQFKFIFISALIVLFGFFRFDHLKTLEDTFPEPPKQETPNNSSTALSDGESTSTYSTIIAELDEMGELLVEVSEGHDMSELQNIVNQFGLTYQRAFFPSDVDATDLDDYFVINVPDQYEDNLKGIEDVLLESGLVDYIEENEVVNISPMEAISPDRKKRSYGINDPGVEELWGFEAMNMDELYTLLKKKGVKPKRKANVFILDTGIDALHEDLSKNYRSYKKEYDNDQHGHGTHCAGIAASVTNNNKGVASFAPNNDFVNVTAVQVLAAHGGGTQQGIISGMLEAADAGADVISMSLGGPSNKSRRRAYARAVNYCNRKGAIVVAAAGNSNKDAANYSPANSPGIITVAAIDVNLERAVFSNKVDNVDRGIAAPGVQIYSTFPNDEYKTFNGTSMACPYVAGLLGIMKSIDSDLDTKTAYDILNSTGKDTKATKETGKLIQPAKAVGELL